jgi:phospholipid transport system substrate-binding protein
MSNRQMRARQMKSSLLAAAAAVLGGAFLCGVPAPVRADAPASAPSAQEASQLVQDIATGLLKQLDANRAAYRKDPKLIKQLVDQYLLPHFDIQYAARLVLGRHWRDATDEQRTRFVSAFETSMLQNYGSALADFTSNRMKVLPARGDPGSTTVSVPTTITRDDGSTVPVTYVLHMTPQGWKAWDVNVEGISYVKSFRDDFGAEIDQKGLEEVIQRLESGVSIRPANAPANAPAGAR